MERLKPYGLLPQSGGIESCLRADLLRGLSGINPSEFLYPFFLDEESIENSLGRYIKDLKSSGELRQRLTSELRPTTEIPDPDAVVFMAYHRGGGNGKGSPFNHFYFDAQRSLLMFQGSPEAGNGACLSFMIIADPGYSRFAENRGIDSATIKKNDIIIVQLQTAIFDRPKLTHPPLHPFRWEIILTGMIASWAKQAGFPRILMQPAVNNCYYKHHPLCQEDRECNERLERRYDGTATSFGFKRPNEKGPFIFNFPTSSFLS